MKKVFLMVLLIVLLVAGGCSKDTEVEQQTDYEKCTSVCSSVLSEDYVTLHLCNEECRKEFLDEGETAP